MSEPSEPTREGGRVAAFFDVDHTLIEVNSGREWLTHLWKQGRISLPDALRSTWWLVKYRLSVLDYEEVTRKVIAYYSGQDVAELEAEVEAWFDEVIRPRITVEGRAKVEEHRAQGHELIMLTSGARFSTEPLRIELDIPHLICTRLLEEEGKLTGTFEPPACFSEGKLFWAERFAEEHGIDLDKSFFYSDSLSDWPMLARVGKPRVINPDPRLKRKAKALGWGYEKWESEEKKAKEARKAEKRRAAGGKGG